MSRAYQNHAKERERKSAVYNVAFFRDQSCMRRKEVAILFAGITLCLGACQSPKTANKQYTDPNAVFAQGGAHEEAGSTPARGGGRRNRAQTQPGQTQSQQTGSTD
ncbi:MAG TPA: hypothetical protein VE860_08340 [Chthoniobacterales bacterium]|jgi:hypothetical protein|nr:hypothetical protein [Chthoniobacterales bacterium]